MCCSYCTTVNTKDNRTLFGKEHFKCLFKGRSWDICTFNTRSKTPFASMSLMSVMTCQTFLKDVLASFRRSSSASYHYNSWLLWWWQSHLTLVNTGTHARAHTHMHALTHALTHSHTHKSYICFNWWLSPLHLASLSFRVQVLNQLVCCDEPVRVQSIEDAGHEPHLAGGR